MVRGRNALLVFLITAATALAVRWIHLQQAQHVPFFQYLVGDAEAYDDWARRIVGGDFWSRSVGVFYQAPLYPYFLAAAHALVGDDIARVRMVQAAIGAMTCGLTALAGMAFFSSGVGIVAGLILALYPPAIYFDTLIQKSVLEQFFAALLLWRLARITARPRLAGWASIGAVLALFGLTRENALLLAPVLMLWIALHFRDRPLPVRAKWIAAVLCGAGLMLGPVAIRNRVIGGEWALTTFQAGVNFYYGNDPKNGGLYVPLRPGRGTTAYEREDATQLAEMATGRKLTPIEISHYWFDRTFSIIRDEPGAWLRTMFKKAAMLVNAYEIPDIEDQYIYEARCPLLGTLGRVGHMGWLFPLAVAGAAATWPRRRDLLPLYLVIGTLAFAVVLFYICARYRSAMAPGLAVLAAAAIVQFIDAIRARSAARVGVLAAWMVIPAAVCNYPIFSRQKMLATAYLNAGAAFGDRGEFDRAIEQFETAIQLDPRLIEARANMGIIRARQGRMREAVRILREALKIMPDDPRTEMRLGTALAQIGDPDASQHLRRAIELFPRSPEAVVNLSSILIGQGRWSQAIQILRDGFAAMPEDASVACALARALSTCPDAALRDGALAVQLGERLCASVWQERAQAYDVFAAALAEVGRFPEAAMAARKAIGFAEAKHDKNFAEELRYRVSLYEGRSPLRLFGSPPLLKL